MPCKQYAISIWKNDNITYHKFEAKCHNDTIKTKEHIRNKINKLPNNSIFHFGYNKQINSEDGHIWTLIKSNDKLYIVDGQEKRGKNHSLKSILPRINYTQKVELLRVDNLNFSDEIINFFAYPHMRVE